MTKFLLTCLGVVAVAVMSHAAPYPEAWTAVGMDLEDESSLSPVLSGAGEAGILSPWEFLADLPAFTYDDERDAVQLADNCIPGWERWQCFNSCIADLGRCEAACLLGPASELASCQLGCMADFRACRRACSSMPPQPDETEECTPPPY